MRARVRGKEVQGACERGSSGAWGLGSKETISGQQKNFRCGYWPYGKRRIWPKTRLNYNGVFGFQNDKQKEQGGV